MKAEFMRVLAIVVSAAAGLTGLLYISVFSPLIMGEDPYSLMRYVLIRLAALLIAAPFLTGLMLVVDFVTPGDWMESIRNDPKACSYVMASVVLVIGAILCWS
jgi:hypothetical protein